MAAPTANLKAKLTEKTRYRPTAMIKPLMPAGATSLETVPMLEGDHFHCERSEAEIEQYVTEIRRTAKLFVKLNCKEGTLAEHDKYMIWIDSWARLSGFT